MFCKGYGKIPGLVSLVKVDGLEILDKLVNLVILVNLVLQVNLASLAKLVNLAQQPCALINFPVSFFLLVTFPLVTSYLLLSTSSLLPYYFLLTTYYFLLTTFSFLLRKSNHSFPLHTIHQYAQGLVKAHMSHVLCLFDGGHGIENILAEKAIGDVRVYRKVAHTKASEVLKEVRSLAWVNAVVV